MRKVYVLLTIMVLFTGITIAQPSTYRYSDDNKKDTTTEKIKFNSFEVALMGGLANYYGDLSDNNFFPGGSMSGKFNWSAGLRLRYNMSRYYGFQGSFAYGKMSSQLESNKDYFNGSTMDFDLGIFVNLTTLLNPKKYNKRWYWDVNLNFGGNKYSAEAFDVNDVSIATSDDLIGNFGIGTSLQYRITDKLDLGLDLRVNKTGTDVLDAIAKGKSNDAYGHLHLVLGYTFGKNKEAYKWNPMEDELAELWNAVNKNTDNIDSLDQRVSMLEAYHGKGQETLPDDDNDGVANEFDQSPNTPEGALVNFLGIPIPEQDTTNMGTATNEAGAGSVLGSVFFDYNRASVNRTDYKKLASVAQYLNSHDGSKVQIVGHTDKTGSDEYNEKLSQKRSEAVKSILVDGFGIDESRLELVAEGKKTNLSEKYDDVNRRVDVIVK